MASRTLAGLALFGLTVFPLGAAPAGAQATMVPPAPAASGAPAQAAAPAPLPSPITSLPPASQPVTLPYPAYGSPVPGVNRGTPTTGVPEVVSLDQAVAIGFARSPLLAQARATIEIDTAPVELAKTAVLPNIAGTASTGRTYRQAGSVNTGGTGSGTISGLNGAATSPTVTNNSAGVSLK